MIAGSLAIKCSPYVTTGSLVFESSDLNFNFTAKSKKFKSFINCNNNKNNYNNNNNDNSSNNKVPKLEPFSRSKFERAAKDPPLIDKSEAQLSDYCSTLEGENSYDCWQAYFELKDLEKESTKEEVEKLIIESGGVKSLIGCLHGVAAIRKANKEDDHDDEQEEWKTKSTNTSSSSDAAAAAETNNQSHHHIPDGGLPKTAEEIEEEEKAKMPDSDFTRLLRHRGKHAAWYSPTPDHQTD